MEKNNRRKIIATLMILIAAVCIGVFLVGRGYLSGNHEVKEFTAFFNVSETAIHDDNEIQKKIAEITGAKCKEIWLSGGTADQAVSELIAGGEYPDFVSADPQFLEEGVLIPIDQYWDSYPNIKDYLPEEKWERFRQADGHIYWIPQFGVMNGDYEGNIHSDEAFWIQTRVLKWAGYPDIQTLDEYFELLEAYAKANPTMENGTENIPYTILCDDWRYFCLENPPQFLDGYPNDGSVTVDPDTLQAGDYNVTPTAKRYFQKLNEMFQKGMIDVESFTQTYEEYLAKLSTGRVLGMCDQWWQFAYNVNDSLARQELAEEGCNYVPLPITIEKGIRNQWHTKGGDLLNVADGLAITTDCDDIEGALQFVNDLLNLEVQTLRYWGIEGVDYEVDEDGIFYRTKEQRERAGDLDYQLSHICNYAYFPHHERLPDGLNAHMPQLQQGEFWESLPKDVKDCLAAYDRSSYVDMLGANDPPGKWFPLYSYSDQLSDATDGGAAWKRITRLKQEFLPRVVMAEDFEAVWAEYLEQYEACNPEAFLAEMQAELERRIAK